MGVDAIYLLTPTTQNVDRIIADFANGRRTYKGAHLYFIDGACSSTLSPLALTRPGSLVVIKPASTMRAK